MVLLKKQFFKNASQKIYFSNLIIGTSKNTPEEILITDESFGNPASPTHSNTSSTAKSNKKISFQVKDTRSTRSSKISKSETDDIRYGFKYKMSFSTILVTSIFINTNLITKLEFFMELEIGSHLKWLISCHLW